MTNTQSDLASFGHFSIPASFVSSFSLNTGHLRLTTILPFPAPRRNRRSQGECKPFAAPWLLPDTDTRTGKDRTGPDHYEQSRYVYYVTEEGK